MAKVVGIAETGAGIESAVKKMRKSFAQGNHKLMIVDKVDSAHYTIDAVDVLKIETEKKDDWINSLDEILLKILAEYNFTLDGDNISPRAAGTMYYAVVLRQIILFLLATNKDPNIKKRGELLKKQVLDKYSQFYLDIAGNFLPSGGIKTLHMCIEEAAKPIDINLDSQSYFSDGKYMLLAWPIAEVLANEIILGNIKVEKREVDVKKFMRCLKAQVEASS